LFWICSWFSLQLLFSWIQMLMCSEFFPFMFIRIPRSIRTQKRRSLKLQFARFEKPKASTWTTIHRNDTSCIIQLRPILPCFVMSDHEAPERENAS
jgi:hypothetical protein